MGAECRQCGHDVYADEPCAWCEIVNERNRYRQRALEAEAILLDVARIRRSDAWGVVSTQAKAHLDALPEERRGDG